MDRRQSRKQDRGNRRSRRCKKILLIQGVALCLAAVCLVYLCYRFNVIPHRQYSNADFGITAYVSGQDRDEDGVDDQTDILTGARAYVDTKPRYQSKYYETGYPDDRYGVCTDVVAQAMLAAGYDLMTLVNEDVLSAPDAYDILDPDINIDFRRVRNLAVYFQRNAIALTTDISDIEAWQGGDIVIFKGHIGIVSDRRNSDGVPFVIHHANPLQPGYEEDILEYWGDIIGHYRVS